jgi:hypothetical protein
MGACGVVAGESIHFRTADHGARRPPMAAWPVTCATSDREGRHRSRAEAPVVQERRFRRVERLLRDARQQRMVKVDGHRRC